MKPARILGRQANFEIVPLRPEDCSDAAALHASGFSRAWSDGEIRALLAQKGVFGFIARPSDGRRAAPAGFVLARTAADEAEILTVAVSRQLRRDGMGWRLMGAVIRHLRAEAIATLFLEVDETNRPAIALYEKLGFRQVAERSRYYTQESGVRTAALVLRLDLG